MKFLLGILTILYITNNKILFVCGFSAGPPETVCESMVPNHGRDPQNTESPYRILIDRMQRPYYLLPGQLMNITIDGQGEVFKGYFIQARAVDKGEIIGTFDIDDNDPFRRQVGCGSNDEGGVSHVNPDEKAAISLLFVTPTENLREFVFRATVVKQFDTFWVGIESAINEVNTSPNASTTHSPQPEPEPTDSGSGSRPPMNTDMPPLPPQSDHGSKITGCNFLLVLLLSAALAALIY